ncbi:RusA-like resolvase [Anabaena phage Elbi]|nr:RusA-like resolvase [Anabaena phage Elbi]
MSIIKYSFKISWFPKPRGGIGRYGNMTHSSGGYRQWQKRFLESLKEPGNFPKKFHGLVFFFYIKPKPGSPPDLENLQGGVQDTLKKAGCIKDDNYKYIGRYYTDHIVVEDYSRFDLYVVFSRKEMLYVIENLLPETDNNN